MASISTREHIRWLPGPPEENTSTVVLTSPGRRFVDIRILLRPGSTGAHVSSPDGDASAETTTTTGRVGDQSPPTATLSPSDVDWAFAGYSRSSEPREDGSRHAAWLHVVDSRMPDHPERVVVDEADVYPYGDGDGRSRTIERGRMPNPDTGVVTDYEELWVDVEPQAAASSPAEKARCVVLELGGDHGIAGTRGMVVCLGRRCQGVVRAGAEFALEQWVWEEQSGWRRENHVGELWLPCVEAFEGNGLEIGGKVERDGLVWTVMELGELAQIYLEMLDTLKRALSAKGAASGTKVENNETGCRGTSFPLSKPQEGMKFRWEGPHHTGKCKCLTTRDISLKTLNAHVDRLLERGLIQEMDVGSLTLKLILRVPVDGALELKLEPRDTGLKLASGEEFPWKLERASTLQSFPALDETNFLSRKIRAPDEARIRHVYDDVISQDVVDEFPEEHARQEPGRTAAVDGLESREAIERRKEGVFVLGWEFRCQSKCGPGACELAGTPRGRLALEDGEQQDDKECG
ncbi:hypothetical protein DL767_004111 [Monosporascus sp. MG133]|nr:hypothetical protein DL767_004111 [Monosporascus sp. MG133]